MQTTATSESALPGVDRAAVRRRGRARGAARLAAIATIAVLGPGAYTASAIVAAPPALAAKKKPKHHCKKGFVYQHGKCRASSRPVY